jgi:hypothetical protein
MIHGQQNIKSHNLLDAVVLKNPFQSRDAIWYHTFNSVPHMLQLLGAGKG